MLKLLFQVVLDIIWLSPAACAPVAEKLGQLRWD